MSIFGNIASAIFKHGSAAATPAAAGSATSPAKATRDGQQVTHPTKTMTE
jgi:hypothetical protein